MLLYADEQFISGCSNKPSIMKVSPLKNIVSREVQDTYGNVVSWQVLDSSGNTIPSCKLFIDKLQGYKHTTKKRYKEAVCKFVDYLYECNILGCFGDGDDLPSRKRINEAIDAYIPLLLYGSSYSIQMLVADKDSIDSNQWKIDAFRALNIKPCKRSSLDNVIAPINRFLILSESLSLEAQDMADSLGIKIPTEYSPLINAVDGFDRISSFQRTALRSASMLGGVIRMHGKIKRPAGIRGPAEKIQTDQLNKDFPVEYMDSLIEAATNWRDRALWLLLLASGIRKSEALNLQWSDIDYVNRRVYVLDPEGRRYGRFMTQDEKIRFKGRTVSWTVMWEPWRSKFFQALEEYRKREWRLPTNSHQFVFQKLIIEDDVVGEPLVQASDAATNQAFNKVAIKAGIPTSDLDGEDEWTPHSLRHAYGVYMLNYIPISSGVFGLQLADVQALMGHASITSTLKYARRKEDVLMQKLQYSDQIALESMYFNLSELPLPLADHVQKMSLSINGPIND